MELGLKGKTAIVTGGSANIGRAISLALAQEGTNVVIADLDEAQGQKVVDKINAMQAGGRCILTKTDVTKLAEVEDMIKKTLDAFGQVDILVNNVGWDLQQAFTDTTPEFWEKVISLNYRSDLNCIKTVLPHMIERKNGSIVCIASDAGRVGEFREAVYSGCKAGVIALNKAIAREVGRNGIRLNVICPGTTVPSPDEIGEGSMWKGGVLESFTPEVQEKIAKSSYPLRRLGKGVDVANAVVFLASDAAGFITGQTLSVSGGYSMM